MAAMSTVLTVTDITGGKFTYTTSGHTAQKPKIVIGNHRVPTGNQVMAEFSMSVLHATEDDDGLILPQKAGITINARQPVNGQSTDLDAVLVIVKDIVNSDEFANSIATLEPLKSV